MVIEGLALSTHNTALCPLGKIVDTDIVVGFAKLIAAAVPLKVDGPFTVKVLTVALATVIPLLPLIVPLEVI